MNTFRANLLFITLLSLLTVATTLAHAQTAADTQPTSSGREASFLPSPASSPDAAQPAPTTAPLVLVPQNNPPPPSPIPPATTVTAAPVSGTTPTTAPPASVPPTPGTANNATPAVSAPPALVSPPPAAPTPTAPVDLGKPVEAGTLGDINPESIGLLSSNENGLGAAMWKNTPRLLVERLLPAVNLPTLSPTLNNLAQRFLLTTASVPNGTAETKQSLVSMRIEKLVALGDVQDAWKLVLKAQPDQIDEITLRLVAEAALVSHERQDVCTRLPGLMKNHTSVEWQKLLLICQLRANDTKAAQLSLDLLHTQNVRDDVFFDLAEKNIIGGSKQLPRQLTPLRPLTLALLRLTDLPLPNEVYVHADSALIPELLQAKAREDISRLGLAERAAEHGLISSTDLASAYHDATFTPDALANTATSAETGPRLHALLYQAALAEQTPQKRIDAALRFLQTASPALLNGGGASVLIDMIGPLQPGADFYAPSANIARINMLAGKPEAALEWLKLARRGAIGMPTLAADLQNLWPLFVLSGLESDADYASHLNQWLTATLTPTDPKIDNHAQREQASLVLLLLEAAGFAVPEEAWAKVIDAPNFEKHLISSSIIPERLRAASVGNRRGETVMLALLLEGGTMADPLSSTSIETIRALRLVGLTADAATYAREATSVLLFTTPSKP